MRAADHPMAGRVSILLVSLMGAVCLAPPSQAQRQYSGAWVALNSEASDKEIALKERHAEPFVEIAPRSSYRSTGAAEDAAGKMLVPQGTVFLDAPSGSATRCTVVYIRFRRFACLIDRDGDGKFEVLDLMVAESELFFAGKVVGKDIALRKPVELVPLDRKTEAPRFVVKIGLMQRGKIMGRTNVTMCIDPAAAHRWPDGKWGDRICLRHVTQINDSEFPRTTELYGVTIAFLSRVGDKVNIRLTYPKRDYLF
jgi:hypothetical protein